jgi:cysteine-rich repeat protein
MRAHLIALSLSLLATHAHAQSACGNGVIDAGEACDDGNLAPGDGCNATCAAEAAPQAADFAISGAEAAPAVTRAATPGAETAPAPAAPVETLPGLFPYDRVPVDAYPLRSTSPKKPGAALAWSLGITLGAMGLGGTTFDSLAPDADASRVGSIAASAALLGMHIIGPSVGHLYAGERRHALRFTALRVASLGAALGGLAALSAAREEDGSIQGNANAALALGGVALIGAGSTGYLVFMVGDLIDAPRAARRHNRALENSQGKTAFSLAPTLIPAAQRAAAPGLALSASF